MIPVIFGISGAELSQEEINFFKNNEPYGFILFKRNCESADQIKALTKSLKGLFPERQGGVDIFIDQEGGRVARIKPPIIDTIYPPVAELASMRNAPEATFENYKSLMKDLIDLGINVTCAPVVDLRFDGAHDVIGGRSFGSDPEFVANMARHAIDGIEFAGGMAVIKHMPGHGRAMCDSHESLPVVSASLEELERTDFRAFKLVGNHSKYAMTAHVLYEAIDSELPATLSKRVIDYIRQEIGFTGTLMGDDISMKALSGNIGELAVESLSAGCNLVLHCNGNMEEMKIIAEALHDFS